MLTILNALELELLTASVSGGGPGGGDSRRIHATLAIAEASCTVELLVALSLVIYRGWVES